MSVSAQTSSKSGTVLYVSEFVPALRILQRVVIVFAVVIFVGTFGALGLFFAIAAESLIIAALAVVFALLAGLFCAALLLPTWRSASMALTVTTDGIEVRGLLRTRWIPWQEVAVIESSTHWYWRRATCIVTTGGERIIAIVTSYQYLLLRGDPYDDQARDPRIPQLPTRIAIDAHRRCLRGEFGR
jgi:hypothetical protein